MSLHPMSRLVDGDKEPLAVESLHIQLFLESGLVRVVRQRIYETFWKVASEALETVH